MHTLLFIGLLIAVTLGSVGLAVFFLGAWNYRRSDSEYLPFGLLALCLALHTGLMAAAYYGAVDPAQGTPSRLLLDLLAATSKIALPLLLHYALRYGGVRREWRVMVPAYGVTGLFLLMIAAGAWWRQLPATFSTQRVFGMEVHQLPVTITKPAYFFYVMVAGVAVYVVFLHGRTYLRGRREGLTAFIGSIVLVATMVNDAALGTGLYPTVPLVPLGYFVLALGVSATFVARLGILSTALERRTTELHQRSEELRQSCEQLEQTQQELVKSEQLAVIGELAAVIAHEVRNPLAIVGNAVASLRKGATKPDDRAQLLEIIDDEMTRLEMLVGRLLNYARPVVLQRRPVDLATLVKRSVAVVDDQGTIELRLDIAASVPKVSGDVHLLRQAFENVVTNAEQAMEDGGTLVLRVHRRSVDGIGAVEVTFEDDGEGMTDETRAQALEPFFTTRSTGTGLGLPIVGRIVEAHGGTVDIDGAAGAGTKVTIVLPERAGEPLVTRSSESATISLLP
jgi:signal transduction histidine kinase